jgi:hypothetical protein
VSRLVGLAKGGVILVVADAKGSKLTISELVRNFTEEVPSLCRDSVDDELLSVTNGLGPDGFRVLRVGGGSVTMEEWSIGCGTCWLRRKAVGEIVVFGVVAEIEARTHKGLEMVVVVMSSGLISLG